MTSGGIQIHRDYWLVDGTPVYAVTIPTAARALDMTTNALEKRLNESPAFARFTTQKGIDGRKRIRIKDVNAIIGLGEELEWTGSPDPKPTKKHTPKLDQAVGGNVIPLRRKK